MYRYWQTKLSITVRPYIFATISIKLCVVGTVKPDSMGAWQDRLLVLGCHIPGDGSGSSTNYLLWLANHESWVPLICVKIIQNDLSGWSPYWKYWNLSSTLSNCNVTHTLIGWKFRLSYFCLYQTSQSVPSLWWDTCWYTGRFIF